jgi:prepilin-type N-terminal cleavage/methylation domain-containing protein
MPHPHPSAAGPNVPRRPCAGFTLTELLVVLVILAIATGVIVPVAHRMMEGVEARREDAAAANQVRREAFNAFVRDEPAPGHLSSQPEGASP